MGSTRVKSPMHTVQLEPITVQQHLRQQVVVLGDVKFSAGDYCISHGMRLLQYCI